MSVRRYFFLKYYRAFCTERKDNELPHQKSTPNYFNFNLISSIFEVEDLGAIKDNIDKTLANVAVGGGKVLEKFIVLIKTFFELG